MKYNKIILKLSSLLLALSAVFLCSCSINIEQPSKPTNGEIRVTVLDVGQGDSIFIELTDNRCMLIDAGEYEYGDDIAEYIRSSGYNKIDYLVATHPHADHIGGMSEIIGSFDIGEIYMPRASTDTRTFEQLLTAIDDKGMSINTARAGVSILSEDNLSIDILAPVSDSYTDLNNYSSVIKLTYGEVKFLFMGDAEKESESEITADVSADFVKVGHHGSKTSSSADFVERVGASYAAVSVAEENEYNLPVKKIINRWKNSGADVLMTKDVGDITAVSDGKTLWIE
ncbi:MULTISPECIES: ComEC/Rec2 family competence protein [unclassified Ruminococcus]|uniref:ComEC/Rec2 family competence protein n=1 Tax=unclassified Ruminococcus TaxID=2608920 RepID=UPI00210B6147|nr:MULTISPECIES: MBL fold metallo-hydrolase [unclassified Ruminococcus]